MALAIVIFTGLGFAVLFGILAVDFFNADNR